MSLKPKQKEDFHYEPKELKNPDVALIFDLDAIKYSSAGVGEKREIDVEHKTLGKKKRYANRTAFWGRGKKIGGELGELNVKRAEKGLEEFTKEDFIITDIQIPEPLENLLHTAKSQVQNIMEYVGTDKAEFFIGKGDSWRVEFSTLQEYKGNRKDLIKPVHLDAVSDYLINKFDPIICEGLEADEMIIMRQQELAAQGQEAAVVIVDKDTYSCDTKLIDMNKLEKGIVDCSGFGELHIDESGKQKKVRGRGRLHLYFQAISQDTSDNYKFNCFSDVSWGEMSAYKVLVECKNDKEALEAMIKTAKKLYPEPKLVEGWRGDDIMIDARYVLNEMFVLARMLENPLDFQTFDMWCAKYGVSWGE